MSGPGEGKNLVQRIFQACVLLLGAAIAINLAIAYVRPALPWIIGALGIIFAVWILTVIVRWRRSRW